MKAAVTAGRLRVEAAMIGRRFLERNVIRYVLLALIIVVGVGPSLVCAAKPLAEQRQAQRLMQAYAFCLTGRLTDATVIELLRHRITIGTTTKLIPALTAPDCLQGDYGLGFQPGILRGVLYEQIYRRTFGQSSISSFSEVPQLDFDSEADASIPTDHVEFVALRSFADCVVRQSPLKAQTVLGTSLYSPAEDTAFETLSGEMGLCLGSGSLAFGRQMLKGMLSEAMYKLAAAYYAGRGQLPPSASYRAH